MSAEDVSAAIAAAEAAQLPIDELKLAREPRNDIGNARRLLARFGRDLLHVEGSGWFFWAESHWQPTIGDHGAGPEAIKRAQATAEAIAAEADALETDAP